MKRSLLRAGEEYLYSPNARNVARPIFQKVMLMDDDSYAEAGSEGNPHGTRLRPQTGARAVAVRLVNPTLGFLDEAPGHSTGWTTRETKAVLPIHLWGAWSDCGPTIARSALSISRNTRLDAETREIIERVHEHCGCRPSHEGEFVGDLWSAQGILFTWNNSSWNPIAVGQRFYEAYESLREDESATQSRSEARASYAPAPSRRRTVEGDQRPVTPQWARYARLAYPARDGEYSSERMTTLNTFSDFSWVWHQSSRMWGLVDYPSSWLSEDADDLVNAGRLLQEERNAATPENVDDFDYAAYARSIYPPVDRPATTANEYFTYVPDNRWYTGREYGWHWRNNRWYLNNEVSRWGNHGGRVLMELSRYAAERTLETTLDIDETTPDIDEMTAYARAIYPTNTRGSREGITYRTHYPNRWYPNGRTYEWMWAAGSHPGWILTNVPSRLGPSDLVDFGNALSEIRRECNVDVYERFSAAAPGDPASMPPLNAENRRYWNRQVSRNNLSPNERECVWTVVLAEWERENHAPYGQRFIIEHRRDIGVAVDEVVAQRTEEAQVSLRGDDDDSENPMPVTNSSPVFSMPVTNSTPVTSALLRRMREIGAEALRESPYQEASDARYPRGLLRRGASAFGSVTHELRGLPFVYNRWDYCHYGPIMSSDWVDQEMTAANVQFHPAVADNTHGVITPNSSMTTADESLWYEGRGESVIWDEAVTYDRYSGYATCAGHDDYYPNCGNCNRARRRQTEGLTIGAHLDTEEELPGFWSRRSCGHAAYEVGCPVCDSLLTRALRYGKNPLDTEG